MARPESHLVTQILYISSVASQAEFARMKSVLVPGAPEGAYGLIEAGTKFHTLLQEGLVSRPGVHLTSLVGRSVSPDSHRGGWWPAVTERLAANWRIHHSGFLNAHGWKQLGLLFTFFFQTLRWRFRTRKANNRIVLIDGAYLTSLPGALLATALTDIPRIGVFCDVYSYMAPVADASKSSRKGQRLIRAASAALYRQLDGFVFLTPQMDEVLNQSRRPWALIEGLVPDQPPEPEPVAKAERPTLMYAGALREQYGTRVLVESIAKLDQDVVLEIYGTGDYLPDVQAASAADSRICYGGYLPNAEIERRERRAWLLINPRPPHQEFARYSFPSKLMEYLVSGTPVLTTKLPGIPAEYFDYFFPIEEPSAAGIAEAISKALAVGPEALAARGAAGQQFVWREKSQSRQADRVLELAQSCRDQM